MEGIGNLGSQRVHMVGKRGKWKRGEGKWKRGGRKMKENGKGRVGKWTGKEYEEGVK